MATLRDLCGCPEMRVPAQFIEAADMQIVKIANHKVEPVLIAGKTQKVKCIGALERLRRMVAKRGRNYVKPQRQVCKRL